MPKVCVCMHMSVTILSENKMCMATKNMTEKIIGVYF